MGFGKILHEALEFSNELDILHRHITKNNLQVQKSDSFEKQCFLLERYMGEEHFQSIHKKMNIVNIMSGVFAFPVLLIILMVYVYAKWIDKKFDVFGFFLNNPALYIVPAVLIAVTIIFAIYHCILRNNLYYKIYPKLKEKLRVEDVTFE
ncbi:DUF6097 family protein [Clostridium saccharoperbutylacetonicum]|uniref:DUF6097 family protein n=1 Tax=Clostridium saccharoperbutylacetonicum TaxID=36745 RepID=UPI000983E9A5|nr:DUF6097 family protein [Clostridium saccharoperbutylacetonicum]AQR96416.1 hypothetical protein CLSAP_37400 [Clostridium saccharoperbutylacetonicum]NSB32289.1 hypothetical protein [Clostridium saccharoperbutylacetonicum]